MGARWHGEKFCTIVQDSDGRINRKSSLILHHWYLELCRES